MTATTTTPALTDIRVSREEFYEIRRSKGAPSVRMFQLPNGGDDIYTVTIDRSGKVVDLVHDFPAIF